MLFLEPFDPRAGPGLRALAGDPGPLLQRPAGVAHESLAHAGEPFLLLLRKARRYDIGWRRLRLCLGLRLRRHYHTRYLSPAKNRSTCVPPSIGTISALW